MKIKDQNSQFKVENSIFYFLFSKFSLLILLSTFYFLFSVNLVEAAQLFFEPKTQEIRAGDYFQIDLFLDTQGEEDKSSSSPFAGAREDEEINAVEGKIVFPEDLLEIKEVLDGDSIINFWTEKPNIPLKDTNINTNRHEIKFSGIIPGGFKGVLSPYYEGYKPGKILSLIFKTKATIGEDLIVLKDVKVLLNDGLGTEAKVSIFNFQFSISKEAPQIGGLLPISDPDPPEPFEPTIAQDPNVFDGKWFLVFATQDKGSGIDHYEVQENRRQKIENRKWLETESPYLLKDQKLRSYIYVKAIDKAGNERIAELPPQNPLSWYENLLFWVIIILAIINAYLWARYSEKHQS